MLLICEVHDVMQYAHTFRNLDLILQEQNIAGKADYIWMKVVYLEDGVYVDTDTIAHLPFTRSRTSSDGHSLRMA